MHTFLEPGMAAQSALQVEQAVSYLALLDGDRVRNLLFMGMSMITGYDMRKQRKRRDIISAAKGLFIQYGINRVTVDEIANTARVSKVTIYNHFGSRENLIQEIVLEIIDEENERLHYIAESDMEPGEKIEAVMAAKIESHQTGHRTLIMDAAARDEDLKLKMENAVQEGKKWMRSIYEEAQRTGYAEENIKAETFYAYMEMMAAFACSAGLTENGQPTGELRALFWNGVHGGMEKPAAQSAGTGTSAVAGKRLKLLR
jgi:AcrR family transcriptional regulator